MNGSTDSSSSMRRRATSTKHNNQLVSDGIGANARSAQLALVMTILAACGGDATVSNSSLNVVVPDGGADDIDIQRVDYAIQCDGNADAFLDSSDSFDDAVLVEGSLEVVDGGESNGVPTEVWQAFMDLPPGPCVLQLTASDNDGEVICAAQDTFTVDADATTKINLVLVCNVSFQSPVGMADVDATFSFVVGNFCPDLFVLNVLDSNPVEQEFVSGVYVGVTEVQVRGRDGDSSCGQNCDPQSCDTTVVPPVCTPGPDPGVSIVLSVEQGLMDCNQDGVPDGQSCELAGDQLTEGNISVACPGAPSGLTIDVIATISDGDIDCDKHKVVSFGCPVVDQFCSTSVDCDDGNPCSAGTCDANAGFCLQSPVEDGQRCDVSGGNSGTCMSGLCIPTVLDPPAQSVQIPMVCRNSLISSLVDFPLELLVDPTPIEAGESFTAEITPTLQISEEFLNASLVQISTLTGVTVSDAIATIAISGGTGADVSTRLAGTPCTVDSANSADCPEFNFNLCNGVNGCPPTTPPTVAAPLLVPLPPVTGSYVAGAAGTQVCFDATGTIPPSVPNTAPPTETFLQVFALNVIAVSFACGPGRSIEPFGEMVVPNTDADRNCFDVPGDADECTVDSQCPETDGNECTLPRCDTSGATAVCRDDNAVSNGNLCVLTGGATGVCNGGVCVSCVSDTDCPGPTVCLAQSVCDATLGCLPQLPANEGGACPSGQGSGAGACTAGACESTDECVNDAMCDDADNNVCTAPVCDFSGAPWVCTQDAVEANLGPCDSGVGSGVGVCDDGACFQVDECLVDADCNNIDGTICTTPICDQSGAPWVCFEDPLLGDGNMCPLPDSLTGTCASGVCSSIDGPQIGHNYIECRTPILSLFTPSFGPLPIALPITYSPQDPFVGGVPTDVEIEGVFRLTEEAVAVLLDSGGLRSGTTTVQSASISLSVSGATPSTITLVSGGPTFGDLTVDSDGNGVAGPLEWTLSGTVSVTPDPTATNLTFSLLDDLVAGSSGFSAVLTVEPVIGVGMFDLVFPTACTGDSGELTVTERDVTFDVN